MDATLHDMVDFFRSLADPTRYAVLMRLARSDERPTELSNAIKQPLETVAAALADLESAGLVTARPSDVGGERYYHLDLERLQQRYATAGRMIHPALAPRPPKRKRKPHRVRNRASCSSVPTTARARRWRKDCCARSATVRLKRSAPEANPARCIRWLLRRWRR